MGSRLHIARLGVALTGVSAALLAFALPAFAAPVTAEPQARSDQFAHVDHTLNTNLGEVWLEAVGQTPTTLIGLRLDVGDHSVVHTYCVELTVGSKDKAQMKESRWADYPAGEGLFKSQPKKVNWILHHSFPGTGVKELGDALKVTLTENAAVAATQAAIWHFSNGANLAKDKNAAEIVALYDYLVGDANKGDVDQPKPSLTLTPSELAGKAGEKIGPFTITSNAELVNVAASGPTGVKLVDKNNNPVSKVKAGTDIFVQVPENASPGEATITADATATVERGRLFVGADVRTQTLIVANPKNAVVSAAAKVKWDKAAPPSVQPTTTPAPTTTVPAGAAPTTTPPPPMAQLPNTGASVLPVAGIGALLIAAGAAALILRSRRKNA